MQDRLVNVALLLGTLALLLGLFELYLFVRYENEHDRLSQDIDGEAKELCTLAHPRLTCVYKPGKCGFNSLGFDDDEWQRKTEEGVFRIVLIGDSVAQGQGVRRTERFASLFETLWNQSHEPVIEVINLAIYGYSTTQRLVVLQ